MAAQICAIRMEKTLKVTLLLYPMIVHDGCDGTAFLTFCRGTALGAGLTFLAFWFRVTKPRSLVRKLEAVRRTMET